MDMEYIHSAYPTTQDRTFNFPCIFADILVLDESNISLKLFVNKLLCHYCSSYPCPTMRKTRSLNYECLCYGSVAIDEFLSFLERMIATHENLRVYSYGRSDLSEIEHAFNFLSDKREELRFARKNRIRAKRITDLARDVSIKGKALTEAEDDVISKWLLGWKRMHQKVDVNPRLTAPLSSVTWEERFREALYTPIDDAISALLLFLYSQESTRSAPEQYIQLSNMDDFA
jgi:hypothetical protein